MSGSHPHCVPEPSSKAQKGIKEAPTGFLDEQRVRCFLGILKCLPVSVYQKFYCV